jgi:hypothetical protein
MILPAVIAAKYLRDDVVGIRCNDGADFAPEYLRDKLAVPV